MNIRTVAIALSGIFPAIPSYAFHYCNIRDANERIWEIRLESGSSHNNGFCKNGTLTRNISVGTRGGEFPCKDGSNISVGRDGHLRSCRASRNIPGSPDFCAEDSIVRVDRRGGWHCN